MPTKNVGIKLLVQNKQLHIYFLLGQFTNTHHMEQMYIQYLLLEIHGLQAILQQKEIQLLTFKKIQRQNRKLGQLMKSYQIFQKMIRMLLMFLDFYVKEKQCTSKDLERRFEECRINLQKRSFIWQVVINKCVIVMIITPNNN